MLNLTGPLTIGATAAAENSFLAEMVRLMEAAEEGRRLSPDRRPRLGALFARGSPHRFLTFLGWMAATGDWHARSRSPSPC